MEQEAILYEEFEIAGGDFVNGGSASCRVKNILKEIGLEPDIIRRVAIASYEAEMNVVMYAKKGIMKLILTPHKVIIKVDDEGPGIPDIELAMQPGYSTATPEMREMGFGAGMGLPNIKKNADIFNINSTVNKGTNLEIIINLNNKDE
jgi:anti-sigma regulatory factor (Ser/Thr protein kinase)|uniref:Anti-sigma regulatory factor n=1 Tax=candidate division WOR-3 bacterium TaxID=2052148 RepID=A0A7V3RIH8_UNCW3